jgi:hypothetical protein
MNFRTLITEMPHIEYMRGKYVDLKREDSGLDWIWTTIPNLLERNKNRQVSIIDNFFSNLAFVNIFKSDYNSLSSKDKKDIEKKYPKYFWDKYEKLTNT